MTLQQKKTGIVSRHHRVDEEDPSKILLESNKFSGLPQDDTGAANTIETKEKFPPFYVKADID